MLYYCLSFFFFPMNYLETVSYCITTYSNLAKWRSRTTTAMGGNIHYKTACGFCTFPFIGKEILGSQNTSSFYDKFDQKVFVIHCIIKTPSYIH